MLNGRRRPGPSGFGAPARRRGDGYEFAELRAYLEGDDPRRIDWAATARAGTLQTRVIFEDHALVLAVALDASHSMRAGRTRSNLDLACDTAALWFGAAVDDDRCARIEASDVLFPRDLRGRAAARLCAERAEAPGRPFADALRLALATLPRDAELLIVSDFYELEALEPLLRACATRFETTALLASDPWPDGLPLGGFVRLRDAETGTARRLFLGRNSRERYRAAVAAREGDVLARLAALGVRAASLDARGPERALLTAFDIR